MPGQGLVEGFISAFTTAAQMERQKKQDEERHVRESVQDALDAFDREQKERFHADNMKQAGLALENTRRTEDARIADRREDNARMDAKDKAAAENSRAKTYGDEFHRGGERRKTAMLSAGYPEDQVGQAMGRLLTDAQAPVMKANTEAMPGAVSPIMAAMAAMMGGNPGAAMGAAAVPGQPLKPMPTLADIENEQSPQFLQGQANIDSQILRRAEMTKIAEKKMELDLTLGAATAEYDAAKTKLAEAQAEVTPIKVKYQKLYDDRKLKNDEYRAQTDRWKAQINSQKADKLEVRKDVKAMADALKQEMTLLAPVLKTAEAVEHAASMKHRTAGNTIELLRKQKMKDNDPLMRAYIVDWQDGLAALPEATKRVQELRAEMDDLRLKASMLPNGVPLTNRGTAAKVPGKQDLSKFSTKDLAKRLYEKMNAR
jgi:hypothetical protein